MQKQLKFITSNIKKGIDETKEMTSSHGKGVTRLPFTLEAKKCAEYLENRMRSLGLTVEKDASGAVIGVLPGKSKERIMIGSHFDSVEHGGAYDGMAGILCGLEVASYYIQNNQVPPFTIEVVGTNDEEGARFGGGYFSSKAFLGMWNVNDLKDSRDAKGISCYDAMTAIGLEPMKIQTAKRDLNDWKGFVEIHIEQGPVLERSGKELGIVSAIVAMKRCYITIEGTADHAGTQPMNTRLDAVTVGVELIRDLNKFAKKHPGMVETVGEIHVFPNEINIVPQGMVFSVDIRSTNEEELIECMSMLEEKLEKWKQRGYKCKKKDTLNNSVTVMKEEWTAMLTESAQRLGISNQMICSGAGHDAAIIGKQIDTVMLFVPSIGGRSHIPEEKSDESSLAQAVLVVIDFIEKLAERRN